MIAICHSQFCCHTSVTRVQLTGTRDERPTANFLTQGAVQRCDGDETNSSSARAHSLSQTDGRNRGLRSGWTYYGGTASGPTSFSRSAVKTMSTIRRAWLAV